MLGSLRSLLFASCVCSVFARSSLDEKGLDTNDEEHRWAETQIEIPSKGRHLNDDTRDEVETPHTSSDERKRLGGQDTGSNRHDDDSHGSSEDHHRDRRSDVNDKDDRSRHRYENDREKQGTERHDNDSHGSSEDHQRDHRSNGNDKDNQSGHRYEEHDREKQGVEIEKGPMVRARNCDGGQDQKKRKEPRHLRAHTDRETTLECRDEENGFGLPVILGICGGALIAIFAFAAIVVCCYRRRMTKSVPEMVGVVVVGQPITDSAPKNESDANGISF